MPRSPKIWTKLRQIRCTFTLHYITEYTLFYINVNKLLVIRCVDIRGVRVQLVIIGLTLETSLSFHVTNVLNFNLLTKQSLSISVWWKSIYHEPGNPWIRVRDTNMQYAMEEPKKISPNYTESFITSSH